MNAILQQRGVFLYRPPEMDCPWLVVILDNSEVKHAIPFAKESDAKKALIEQTTLFIQSHAKDDLD